MGKIFDAIDSHIIKPRVQESSQKGFEATKEDILSFYTQGDPKWYKRTGKYGNSPSETGVTGGHGDYYFEIYLAPPEYTTGLYDGQKVMEEAQWNGSGILGRAGTWFEAEKDIYEAVRAAFK